MSTKRELISTVFPKTLHSVPTSPSFQAAFGFSSFFLSLPFSPSLCLPHLHWPECDKYIVYHEVHDCLRHEVSDGFVDNCHVGIHQVPDRFHLSLQLRVHGVHETVWSILLRFTGLQRKGETDWFFTCNKISFSWECQEKKIREHAGNACNK